LKSIACIHSTPPFFASFFPEAQDFSKKFEEAMTINAALLGTVESVSATNAESDKAADELASGLEKVAVAE
jgi:hypothetical protein